MFGKFRMRHEVTRRAVHGDCNEWTDEAVHLGHLLTRRVAGDMDRRIIIGDQDDLAADQPVLNTRNGRLVPRNLA